MKKLFTLLGISLTVFLFTENNAHTNQSGAPMGNTGSQGDANATCNTGYCHSSSVAATDQTLTITMQENTTREYTIWVESKSETPFQYSKAGFQACVEDGAGNKIGTLATLNSTLTKIIGSGSYITHTTAGTSPSEEVFGSHHYWSFSWTAPEDFNGEASVYAASMLTNNNGSDSGDTNVTSSYLFNVGVGIETLNVFDFSVYPNPASEQLSINMKEIPGENSTISLCDVKGAFTTLITGNLKENKYNLSIPSYLAEGIYTLTVSSPKGQTSKKIMLK
tara:strand:- start:1520 stop:2353 length:834 start_codon:yes stop_codon:yes gene_type:complete